MLSTNFFGTTEIVIVQHTQCGMLSADARDIEAYFRAKGIDTDAPVFDPTLPELKLDNGGFAKWLGMMDDVDETLLKTIEVFENHPLIADDVTISGWVWEVETRRCGRPLAIRRAGPAPMRRRATTVSPSLNLPAGTWAMVSKTSPPRPTRCAEWSW